tara:strand:- start:2915 stop:3148 length:234 start_codon:yes stop_codon:yes gene_type:complete
MTKKHVKVKDHSNLVRDPSTNCIINTSQSEYNQYLARKKTKRKENERVNSVEDELSNLKDEISEIKSLLKELVNGNK